MGETNEFYSIDSRVPPDVGRAYSSQSELPDIGFNAKFIICVVVGSVLVFLGLVLLLLMRFHPAPVVIPA